MRVAVGAAEDAGHRDVRPPDLLRNVAIEIFGRDDLECARLRRRSHCDHAEEPDEEVMTHGRFPNPGAKMGPALASGPSTNREPQAFRLDLEGPLCATLGAVPAKHDMIYRKLIAHKKDGAASADTLRFRPSGVFDSELVIALMPKVPVCALFCLTYS